MVENMKEDFITKELQEFNVFEAAIIEKSP